MVDDVRERLRAKLRERIAARGVKPKPAKATAAPCRHLGKPTGATVPCATCAGTVQLKVLACGVFGACTPTKKVKGVACCEGCGKRVAKA